MWTGHLRGHMWSAQCRVRTPLPDPLPREPFSVARARALGVSPDRLRGSDLARPYYAVRSVRQPRSTFEWARAYLPRMKPGSAFSHVTAAALWGMPLPRFIDLASIHVTAPAPNRAPSGRGVSGHSQPLPPGSIREVGGLPVLEPASVWVQLSAQLPWRELVAVGDFLVTGLPFDDVLPLATVADLRAAHVRSAGSRGSKCRTRALEFVSVGPFSRPESLCSILFSLGGLPPGRVNESIVDERGSFLALPDQSWPEYRVAFEYEGEHHRGRSQFRRDIARIETLIDHDWRIVKGTADDLFEHPEALLGRVARRLRSAGWPGQPRELRHFGPLLR